MFLREELPKDFKAVEHLHRETCWNLYYPGTMAHYAVYKTRPSSDYIR